ncbi:MAG: SDR family NAD(P)-dependent oxidoreductase [Sphingomonadales bacterium]|nr:MAG: SDR family NAD(P)-dependent oxidoreductase [Sphingomonadales bacterium]
MKSEPDWQHGLAGRVLVTGASGLLGRELSLRIARPGVRLSLWGRNPFRLTEVATQCREAGAEVEICALDISNPHAAISALCVQDDADPFSLALLVAGLGDTLSPGAVVEGPAQVIRLAQTNFVAPAAMASFLAERMVQRGKGRIGLVGTAAAAHSLPFAASYSGSKAGLARFADALRLAVRNSGVSVTLISPGFFGPGGQDDEVRSRPGEIAASVVAEQMIAAVVRGKPELVVPRRFLALRWFDRLLPRPLRDRLLLSLRLP